MKTIKENKVTHVGVGTVDRIRNLGNKHTFSRY